MSELNPTILSERRVREEISEEPIYITRRGVVELATKLGIPLKYSKLVDMARNGNGPKPDSLYGTTHLYTPQTARDWLLNKVVTKPSDAA